MKKITFVAPGTQEFSLSDDFNYLVQLEVGTDQSQQLLLTDVQTGATQTVATEPGNDSGTIANHFQVDNSGFSAISPDDQFVAYVT